MIRRLFAFGVVGMGTVLAFAGSALASGPPSFDVSTITPALYLFGVAVLAGVVALIGPVLLVKTPFVLVRVALAAIRRLFGRAHPSAA